MKKLLRKTQSGFTIIEVTIVLAIAAIIMVIVFTAVPALERSSRNTQRRNDASHYANLVNEYVANNGGALPTAAVSLGNDRFSRLTATPQFANAVPGTLPTATDTVYLYTNAKCGGTNDTTPVSGGSLQAVVFYNVETSSGGAQPQCIDVAN